MVALAPSFANGFQYFECALHWLDYGVVDRVTSGDIEKTCDSTPLDDSSQSNMCLQQSGYSYTQKQVYVS